MTDGLAITPLLVGAILALAGATFAFTGRTLRQSSKQFLATSVTTQAQVLDLRYRQTPSHSASRGTYHPLLRYTLPDGRIVEAEASYGSSPAPATQGQVVPVRYDPKNPTTVQLANGLVNVANVWVFFIILGLLFFVIGVVVIGVAILLAVAVDLP
ncbi:MAG: DUF3592 domain-containing protein [Ornithinimicrobium sp.]